MKRYPAIPGVDDVDAGFFEGGHVWVQELVAGELVGIQVQASGALVLGTRRREFSPGDAPLRYRHAVQSVRDDLAVDALRAAVADVESVTLFGVATQYAGVPYDWGRTPSVLGVDVWDADRGEFLRVDAAERALAAFGLDAVNVLRKEVHVRDYGFADEPVPRSAWYDGPAAGVVVRKKTGERLAIPNAAVDRERTRDPPPAVTADADGSGGVDGAVGVDASGRLDATAVADATATRERFERVARTVRDRGLPVTFDVVYDRLLAAIYRETHDWLLDDDGRGDPSGRGFDLGAFRDAVAERTNEHLAAD
jgi:hypothetical protein